MSRKDRFEKTVFSSHGTLCCFSAALLVLLFQSTGSAQTYGPNLLPAGDFSSVRPTYVPWAGVDDQGNLHGIDGAQLAAGEDGTVRRSKFGPSIAVGDFNGDGKPDLLLADSMGFFWLYLNSGTAQSPVFTQGEIAPIWLGEERIAEHTEGVSDIVPRIQLIDFQNNKKLDVVAGTYAGKLFHVPNSGTLSQPLFQPTYNRDALLIPTHTDGILWCNYLAPCLTSFGGDPNGRDLVVGDGTYSANSIYLLHNTHSSTNPAFDENHREKIIPGMGMEQITPCVFDWNGDGKPDILAGDRTGNLTLFLNNSTDSNNPTFAPGVRLKIAGMKKLGGATTVSIGDLTGNHLPNLLIGRDDGTILYALNTGRPGAPVFNTPPTPLKGVLPPDDHYTAPVLWWKDGAWGAPDELLACVNSQLEPGFAFPEGEKSTYALKFSVWPVKNILFPVRYYPQVEDEWREHVIRCRQGFALKLNTRYRVHFWVKGEVSNLRYKFYAGNESVVGFHAYNVMNPVDVSSTWTESTSEIEILNPDKPAIKTWPYAFEFRFTGQGTFYLDDVQIQEKL